MVRNKTERGAQDTRVRTSDGETAKETETLPHTPHFFLLLLVLLLLFFLPNVLHW
jgi:hypothetical protein